MPTQKYGATQHHCGLAAFAGGKTKSRHFVSNRPPPRETWPLPDLTVRKRQLKRKASQAIQIVHRI